MKQTPTLAKPYHSKGGSSGRGAAKIHSAKLTEDDVRAIRKSDKLHNELAKKYNVSRYTIGKVKNRKIWSHIED